MLLFSYRVNLHTVVLHKLIYKMNILTTCTYTLAALTMYLWCKNLSCTIFFIGCYIKFCIPTWILPLWKQIVSEEDFTVLENCWGSQGLGVLFTLPPGLCSILQPYQASSRPKAYSYQVIMPAAAVANAMTTEKPASLFLPSTDKKYSYVTSVVKYWTKNLPSKQAHCNKIIIKI